MATIVYFDSENASGGRDGAAPVTAYNDSDFATYNFSKATDYEFKFANGSVFTLGPTQKSVGASAGNLKFTNYDRGDGATALPIFRCMTEYAGSPTWTEISAAAALAGTYTAAPGSKLWHTPTTPTGFIGAYLDDNGEVEWGQQCDLVNETTTGADAPDAQGDWCDNGAGAVAGLMIYSDTNPNTYYAQGLRAILAGAVWTGSSQGIDWTFTRPTGGLEMENLRFERCGVPIGVANATAADLVAGVYLHNLEFEGCHRCFSINGSGSLSDGSGFTGLIIESCNASNLAAQFLSTPNSGVAFEDCEIRYNVVKGSCRGISSGCIYLVDCYSTNARPGMHVHHNWLHDTSFGNFWKGDGFGTYAEHNARDTEWSYNLITGGRQGSMLKGTGGANYHHNWIFAGADTVAGDAAILVTDDTQNDVHDQSFDIHQNVVVGFTVFCTVTNNFVTYSADRVRINHNVASGVATNSNSVPIRSRSTTTETHVNVRKNNFFGFWVSGSVTWREYDGGTVVLSHTQADTSTTDNSALLVPWPEPDSTSELNHALKLPPGVTAAGATRGTTQINAPCLAPA